MAKSMLAAIREATLAAADEDDFPENGATPGAAAPQSTETGMSKDNQPAGGDPKAGITQAEHDTAVTAARADGRKDGEKRISTALGAEGVKGDAGRMSAALDLAVKSPGMSGEEVAAFVVANVTASKPAAETPEAHDKRVAAAGLAQPPAKPSGDKKADHGWSAVVAETNKRRG